VSPYAASKKAGELLCHAFHHLHGLDITCLRFFTVYGPRQRPEMAIHKFVRAVLAGEELTVFGDGTSSRDYTYIDDIIDGIVGAIAHLGGYHIYNLGESTPIALSDLIAAIERATGREARQRQLPMQPGDVTRTYASTELARAEIDYSPHVGLDEGLHRFVKWLRS